MEKSLSAAVSKSLTAAAALIKSQQQSAALAQLKIVWRTLVENQVEAASAWSALFRHLGDLYKSSSDYLKALKHYQKALQRDSSDNANTADTHFGIGSTLCLTQNYEAAVDYLFYAFHHYSHDFALKKRAALKLASLYYYLALAHEHMNKREEACNFYCRGHAFAVQHLKACSVATQLKNGVQRLKGAATRAGTPSKSRRSSSSLLAPGLLKHCRDKERSVIRIYLGRPQAPVKQENQQMAAGWLVALVGDQAIPRNRSASVLPPPRNG